MIVIQTPSIARDDTAFNSAEWQTLVVSSGSSVNAALVVSFLDAGVYLSHRELPGQVHDSATCLWRTQLRFVQISRPSSALNMLALHTSGLYNECYAVLKTVHLKMLNRCKVWKISILYWKKTWC